MGHQKLRDLLDNTPNQPSECSQKIRLEYMMTRVWLIIPRANVKLRLVQSFDPWDDKITWKD